MLGLRWADGEVPKRLTGADCKSAGFCLRRFESSPLHHQPFWRVMRAETPDPAVRLGKRRRTSRKTQSFEQSSAGWRLRRTGGNSSVG